MGNRAVAVSYVEREDGRILVVWSRRYGAFTLPGGQVEDRETIKQALARDLRGQTGMYCLDATPLYKRESGRMVHVYRVEAGGIAQEIRIGCPVSWFTRDEFSRWTAFKPFYVEMFERLDAGQGAA